MGTVHTREQLSGPLKSCLCPVLTHSRVPDSHFVHSGLLSTQIQTNPSTSQPLPTYDNYLSSPGLSVRLSNLPTLKTPPFHLLPLQLVYCPLTFFYTSPKYGKLILFQPLLKMASLEQAALSGALTTVNLGGIADPDGLEPHRDPSSDDDEAADVMPDLDDDQSYMVNADTTASIMSRGWSGNTGPKGVLLDFKASHGKSGAILGGSDDRGGTNSRKQGSHKKNQIGSNSETDSESDKDTRHAVTTSSLYNGGRRTTHRIADRRGGGFSIGGHARKSSGSPPSVSPIINAANIKTDSRGKKLFGHLREVGVDNFIQAVESERDDKDTVVLVHLYDPVSKFGVRRSLIHLALSICTFAYLVHHLRISFYLIFICIYRRLSTLVRSLTAISQVSLDSTLVPSSFALWLQSSTSSTQAPPPLALTLANSLSLF